MWWPNPRPSFQKQPRAVRSGFPLSLRAVEKAARIAAVLALAAVTAGCFQPLYGERTVTGGGAALKDRLAGVQVAPIVAPAGSRVARVGFELRNELIYGLTGGGGGAPATHKLEISLSTTQLRVIVDINTARPDVQNFGIDATYALVELATGKRVITGQTFSRVSYDIPGQQQRFAGARGLRDAENRAAKVITENIRSRLASYFLAGT